MKSFCTKGVLFVALALLVWSAAACTQSKPAVPTPTLIPLDNSNIVSPGSETPGAPSGITTPVDNATLVPIGGDQTPVAPAGGDATPVPPPLETLAPNVTPIIVEPTLFPTPTTVGDTGQPPAQPTPGAAGGDTGTQTGGACSNPYTVQPGEWFYAIARKCGVTPEALLAANPGLNPNLLRPGQTLNIPGGGTTGGGAPPPEQPTATTGGEQPPATGGCSNPYTVQRGDTLYSIAQKCGTTVAAIQQANGIPAPEYIFPGQQLRIP